MANLNPNLLLYKASAVHNLPVMCQALALGANKLWRNEDDFKRTPLHQAILSVQNSTDIVSKYNTNILFTSAGFNHGMRVLTA